MKLEEFALRQKNNRNSPARSASFLTRAIVAEIDQRNIRYEDICFAAGMHRNSISAYKHGTREMKVMELEAIAQVLGLEIVLR